MVLFLPEYGDTNAAFHNSAHEMHVMRIFPRLPVHTYIIQGHGRDLDPLLHADAAGFGKTVSL